jgi:hypothetical protein
MLAGVEVFDLRRYLDADGSLVSIRSAVVDSGFRAVFTHLRQPPQCFPLHFLIP